MAVRGMLAVGMMKHGALKKRAFLAVMRMLGCYRGVVFQATNTEEVEDVKRWMGRDVEVAGAQPGSLHAGQGTSAA
ncbi:MAG: hypothetical protein IPM68_14270 [Flavobacteriales bacterium]|nr:hypothetical protein [Flavobacteriales bacterium]